MIDYLEPLLRTPQALTQAVAELEDSRLCPQRREGRTNGEESVSLPKASEWDTADWAEEQEGVNRLSMEEPTGETSALDALLEEHTASLPLLHVLNQAEAATSRSAVRTQTQTWEPPMALQPPWVGGETLAADAKAVDLAFQRDSRRYDNGFSLY